MYKKPNGASYFLPGRIEGRQIQFLLDTGCTTNLLSKDAFDRLPDQTKRTLEKTQAHGVLDDDTQLPFYGTICSLIWVRDTRAEEVLVVSRQ